MKYFAVMYRPNLANTLDSLCGTDSHILIDGRLSYRRQLSEACNYASSLNEQLNKGITHIRLFRKVRNWDETFPISPLVSVRYREAV